MQVRRAAAALVIALIEAFPDAAGELYGACHAPLVRKFGEREESVKLDVLAAYGALVRANAAAAEGAMDSETSAAAAAADDTAALLKQAGGRSAALRTAVFAALRTLVEAFAGAGFFGLQAVPAAATALRDDGSANALKIEALRFLRAACVPAAMPDMGDALRDAAPGLAAAVGDKYYKVVVEALAVVEGAATMVARGGGAAREHAEVSLGLLDGVLARLKAGDQDQEVKEGAIRCARSSSRGRKVSLRCSLYAPCAHGEALTVAAAQVRGRDCGDNAAGAWRAPAGRHAAVPGQAADRGHAPAGGARAGRRRGGGCACGHGAVTAAPLRDLHRPPAQRAARLAPRHAAHVRRRAGAPPRGGLHAARSAAAGSCRNGHRGRPHARRRRTLARRRRAAGA